MRPRPRRVRLPPGCARSCRATRSLLGPAPRFRLRDRERRQVLVKAQRRSEVLGAVREAVEGAITAKAFRGVQLSVDVDPQ